ncbi:hypothetical protein T4D_2376 [Trichinella pseudospiralis]|uniref:Uncharacterized protein n=1 Tax=Trichinella pseudospiralis TaxID=6337 RepID=A0A0V1G3X8_TRIPS|nr:hypothetical protein T4D_2376 [Trichinella pseudospiralis]
MTISLFNFYETFFNTFPSLTSSFAMHAKGIIVLALPVDTAGDCGQQSITDILLSLQPVVSFVLFAIDRSTNSTTPNGFISLQSSNLGTDVSLKLASQIGLQVNNASPTQLKALPIDGKI